MADLYASTAVVAGAGIGSPEPLPSFEPGSLVSYTGVGQGDVLLGSTGTGNYVKCDYGETTSGALTCNQPIVASNGFASVQPITLGTLGYTLDCLVTFSSGGCALLTDSTQKSLLLAESSSNFNEGGFLFDGSADINLSSGAYANGTCCTATQTQAWRIQVTNNGNGVIFYYNAGLTPSPSTTFSPSPIAGVNASDTFWASGGFQPNSASAGGSGGYAPETFPLGATSHHPRILSGSCTFSTPSGTCTFPNGFAFTDTTYTCTISAQGAIVVAPSYQRTSTTSITIFVGHLIPNLTLSYICMR